MKKVNWFVYIIECEKGSLYTGITTDVDRRFKEHADSSRGAKYFRGKTPKQIVFQKKFKNRSEASKYEFLIKNMVRADKLKLIAGGLK